MELILIIAVLVFVLIQCAALFALLSKTGKGSGDQVLQKLTEYGGRLDKNEISLRNELEMKFGQSRADVTVSLASVADQLSSTITNFTGLVDNRIKAISDSLEFSSRTNRDELANRIAGFEKQMGSGMSGFSEILNNELQAVKDRVALSHRESREELSASLKSFREESSSRIEALTKETRDGLEKNRDAVEKKLAEIQDGNEKKLEKMRETVDEKLQKTLEARLGESFKQVSERLEQVQKGLGEMQSLASDVGDLKKVMSNVKTKGVLGEYQLEAILEQMLTPGQYEKNVKTKAGSDRHVEFAIKIPSKEDSGKAVWLPVDAKLPTSDYETLVDAYEAGDKKAVDDARKAFSRTVRSFAKEINEKYIDSPNTTDFAIMFLPFEGAYAEVVRDPELFESIQREHKIIVTGPSTIAAFLNALQIGFRSLAVEKGTTVILNTLSAVKKEFGNFEAILTKVKEQIDRAGATLEESVGKRTKAINRALKNVESLPDDSLGQKMLSSAADLDIDD